MAVPAAVTWRKNLRGGEAGPSEPPIGPRRWSGSSKRNFCPGSIFSRSRGDGRGFVECEDDRSLLSQRLASVVSELAQPATTFLAFLQKPETFPAALT